MKVLIIRFSSIGDIVLTTPVVRTLAKQKNAEIHYLTKKGFKNILDPNPNITRVWTFEKDVSEIIPDLKKENFDHVVDLHNNLRSRIVKSKLRKPSSSFNKLNFKKWLLVNLKIDRMPQVHIVDRYLETVQSLGVKNDFEGLDYFFDKPEEEIAKSVHSKLPQLKTDLPFVAFAIGAAHQTKRIPIHRCKEIIGGVKIPVVLLGGPSEATEGEEIAAGQHHVLNSCGKLSLSESAWLIKKAWKVISPDTGMMHVAAAFNKDLISVWGNTVPEFGMTPYFRKSANPDHDLFEVKNLSCRPCSKIGYKSCPKGHFKCMEQLPYDEIVASIQKGYTG
ncbi:MAG: glycosyltransferase family 9 protein [Saprospiraceae bacterium]